jgi:hypothetical protein
MGVDLAFVARGELFVAQGRAAPSVFTSPFAEQVRARHTQIARRSAWKTQGPGARFMAGLGGMPDGDEVLNGGAAPIAVAFTGIGRGQRPGELYYTQITEAVAGLFRLEAASLDERRLFHGADVFLHDPSVHPTDDLVACTLRGNGGIAHIVVVTTEGRNLREVTEGDVLDGAPSWVPGEPRTLVYQSAGVGRDRRGFVSGFGAMSIQRLDLARATVECVLQDANVDFLAPRVASDGTLYAMRRPMERARRASPIRFLGDVLLFPFRLGRAVLHFLEFFSMRYTGKPLVTSGGARARRADMRRFLQLANLVTATRDIADDDGDAPAVSPEWTLVRRAPDTGRIETVASAVTAFDLARDGSVVYADSTAIHHLTPGGERVQLADARGVSAIAVL